LSGFNFASGRIGVIAERDEYKKLQEHVKMNLVQPHFEEWLRHAILSGELKLPIGRLEEFQDAAVFHARRWAYIDPIKDVQRDILSIEAGLDSRQHVISESERGGDTELIDGEQASDMAIDEAHELDFAGSDPTKPTLKPGAPGEEVPNPEGATAPRTGGKQTLKKGRKVNWERAGRALHLERNGEH
jgi:capsid protein